MTKMPKSEKGHNQRILRKNNQAIYIMYPNSIYDIIILTKAFLQTLC